MGKREMTLEILKELGYKPQTDDDGDIFICYQMKTIYFMIGIEEEKYMVVVLPQILDVNEGEEALMLTVCNKVTRDYKLAKVYLDAELKQVYAGCEFFYTERESLQNNFENSLRILGVIRSTIQKVRRELAEE